MPQGGPEPPFPLPQVSRSLLQGHPPDLTSPWFLVSPWFSSHCFPPVLEPSIWPQHKFPNSVGASTSNLNPLIPLKIPLPEGPSFLHLHSLLSCSPQDTSSREVPRLPHCGRYHLSLAQLSANARHHLFTAEKRKTGCSHLLKRPWTLVPPELLCTSAPFLYQLACKR